MQLMLLLAACCAAFVVPCQPTHAEQRIVLLNEIDDQTGHDNLMITVRMFGKHSEIIYCDGTRIEDLLPLIRKLQGDDRQPIKLNSVQMHELELDSRGWVIIGVCNRIKDRGPSILVYSSQEISKSVAMSMGRAFRSMR